MPQDDSRTTSMGDLSRPNTSPADGLQAERTKPYRQQNLSQSERDRLARLIRKCRRDQLRVTRDGLTWAEIRRQDFRPLISFLTELSKNRRAGE
ncbi:MAG: hypothetical protein AB7H90_11595 [Alphaproteobacteria bacterium]